MEDKDYMRMALSLAKKGMGWTSPNPMVGAVIVKDERIIGEGYHHRCGGLHAEREALAACSEDPKGGTMYVTLEPCCHTGRQPPCTEALVGAGISRVVIGSSDPNPLVAGKGIEYLRKHGIEVETGVLEEECDAINYVFFHYITTGTPYVVMKYAMTMDGKIATGTGASKWITGEAARRDVHEQRSHYRAIMVGVGTVIADDPMLDCRIEGGRNPVRIICDTHLRTPMDSRIVRTAREIPTIMVAGAVSCERKAAYIEAGCRVYSLPERDGMVDLSSLIERLGQEEIDSILIEGGASLNWSAMRSGIVNRVLAYIAPRLFGGELAKSPVGGEGVGYPDQAMALKDVTVRELGNDFLIEGEVKSNVYRIS